MSHVQFSYNAETTLHDISLVARGYQKIALIGESGSGKSTLLSILGGFLQPDQGQISVNGQKINHLTQEEWQRQFFYMPQSPYIFHESLRNNIKFYAKSATNESVNKAVEQAGLNDLVNELPEGLDTIIGESGRQLSGGQAQRVALARMLLDSSRKVLLFDEPTAHLDIETEIDLKKTMAPILNQHLVLFATHRLHWLDQMDLVVVMREGSIVEIGQPDVLLEDETSNLNALRHELHKGGYNEAIEKFIIKRSMDYTIS
ncbi:hypothetical protein GCM10025879_06160 [Leuconostoc litchii]|nr:hypothetical protein GCM10025879_06160 [Leuconostoc litchii]